MASRKEQKAALRAERERQEAERAAAAARKRLVAIIAGSLVALGALGAIIAVALSGGDEDGSAAEGDVAQVSFPEGAALPDQQEGDLARAARAAGCKTADPPEEGSGHVETPVTYRSKPPHSGEHHPVPAEDSLYDSEQAKEPLVHSLEHGRIVIWVNPSADEELLGQLRALYDADPYHLIVTPDTQISGPVAASAWTHTLTCERSSPAVLDAIRTFKDKWRDKGPEFVP